MPKKPKLKFAAWFSEIPVNAKPLDWPDLKKAYEKLKREPVAPEFGLAVVDGKVRYCRLS